MKQSTRILLLLVLSLLSVPLVRAQMAYTIDTTTFLIGDQVVLTIDLADQMPSADMLAQDGIVVAGQRFDTIDVDGGKQVVQRTLLTCFDPGEHWLHLGENDSLMLTVLDVEGVDTSSLDIKDIAPYMKEGYTFWEIFRWILLALLVAALVVGVVYVVRRVRNHQPILPVPVAPEVPADQVALQELEALRRRQLWQQGKLKEYYTELTDAVRRYLEKGHGIFSTDMTTDETLDAFHRSALYTAEREVMLRQILTTADMVKFAKSEPLPYEHDRSMGNAVTFVQQTAPKPESDEAEKEEQQ